MSSRRVTCSMCASVGPLLVHNDERLCAECVGMLEDDDCQDCGAKICQGDVWCEQCFGAHLERFGL